MLACSRTAVVVGMFLKNLVSSVFYDIIVEIVPACPQKVENTAFR